MKSNSTECKRCGKEDERHTIATFFVIGSNGDYDRIPEWVVAAYDDEQLANNRMKAAQAGADKLLKDYKDGLIMIRDFWCLKNEYDRHFYFSPEGVEYKVLCLLIVKPAKESEIGVQ